MSPNQFFIKVIYSVISTLSSPPSHGYCSAQVPFAEVIDLYPIVRLWSCVFQDYLLLSSAQTIVQSPSAVHEEKSILLYWYIISKPVCYGGLFVLDCRVFCCFQVRFCPVKRGNRAGFSRNEFHYSRRGTKTSLPLLDCGSCENFD